MANYNINNVDKEKLKKFVDGDVSEVQRQREELSDNIVEKIVGTTGPVLTNSQLASLKQVLSLTLSKYDIMENTKTADIIDAQQENARVLRMFIDAKKAEGRCDSTLYNYAKEVSKLFLCLNKSYRYITAKDIREYMSWRKDASGVSARTIANIRLYLMSFFRWLWVEELIARNPMDKIGVVRVEQHVVDVLSEEEQEMIRCVCDNERDRAIVDLLSGSGMRVSELCGLNRSDVDFVNGEVKVFGKGSKERICFLTGRCKVHLKWYLNSRVDDNPALFVTKNKPYNRITKGGVEYLLRELSKKTGLESLKLHPHKYRSTLITDMINKGADANVVRGIAGHSNVDTTIKNYYKENKQLYKSEHRKYID